MLPESLSHKITLLLLLATLLMGLGHIATLPPLEGNDEIAHYSRIEAQAFTPATAATLPFMSADAIAYTHAGPMKQSWIYVEAFNAANDEALKTGGQRNVAEQLKKNDYTDYKTFFADERRISDYISRYRTQAAAQTYAPTAENNWQYQHPPLYYIIMGGILRDLPEMPFVTRFFILRTCSFLLAFTGLCIGVAATWRHFARQSAANTSAIIAFGAFYPFVMPVFFDDLARLGNDSLCLFLFSIMWSLLLWHRRNPDDKTIPALLGFAMGCSWLAKAFMMPVSAGMLVFMLVRNAPPIAGDSIVRRWLARLLPVFTALLAAIIIGIRPYLSMADGRLPGSGELDSWLHGKGITGMAAGLPWRDVFDNILSLLATAFYPMSSFGVSFATAAVVVVLTAALITGMLLAKKNWRQEEWLPLYTALPLAGGLFVHGVMAAIAYRASGVTPGYYIHVEAQALALAWGISLFYITKQKRGKIWAISLLILAILVTIATDAQRLAISSGCAWLENEHLNFGFDDNGCTLTTVYERLGIVAWPGIGFTCLALAFAFVTTAITLLLRLNSKGEIVQPS